MKIFDEIITFITKLDTRKFLAYLGSFLGGVLLVTGGISYYFYYKSSSLVETIKHYQKLSNEAQETSYLYHIIHERKKMILDALAHEKNFELKSFFEAFCKENNLKPELNWVTTTTEIEGNETLEEVALQATLTKFTMQKLVNLLEILTKKDLVYIKNIKIEKESAGQSTISVDITLATLKYRQGKEEQAS
jgi:transcription initiation factor IIF auxiliary subunit